jgi:membrane protein implicated in regulation of membrane protease activity
MDVLGSVVFLMGFVMLFVGIAWTAYPMPSLGMARRVDGALALVASVALMVLGWQLSPQLQTSGTPEAAASASTSASSDKVQATKEKPISRTEALANLTINGLHWRKNGFGTIMTASFVLHNGNTFPVKDLTVTCNHTANSGTKIDSNTRTIYELIGANGYHSVNDMNMGFIHSAVSSSTCRVTSFSQV